MKPAVIPPLCGGTGGPESSLGELSAELLIRPSLELRPSHEYGDPASFLSRARKSGDGRDGPKLFLDAVRGG